MASPDAQRFLDTMLLATRQAGAVAFHLQGEVPARRKDATDSPEAAALSVADLATQDVLLLALHQALPHAAVDAEEDTEAVSLFPPLVPGRPFAILDPIDGSLNYLDGSADYAVMAAWLEDGIYRAAVVHFPAWEETFWGIEGGGVWRQKAGRPPEQVTLPQARPPVLLVSPRLPAEAARALATCGLELQETRCSAVDSTAPLADRARASWRPDAPGRRRTIGFFLTRLAGGVVYAGGRRWEGEDPYTLPPGPCLTAVDEATAEALLKATAAL
jgi:3'-phosphoadenosine 5'-phosphosulfate (PAPS) 3'-phosphatase